MSAGVIPPVEKSLRVKLPPADAFKAFVDEISEWWPASTHSLGRADKVQTVVFEQRLGGQVYERWKDGTRRVWGSVLEWNPPHLVRFSWHVGRAVDRASEVILSFTADGDGALVRLVHRNWEAFGADARQTRDGYEAGWGEVFVGHFARYALQRR